MNLVDLKRQLSTLSMNDRAALALYLLNSLDESQNEVSAIEEAWRTEAGRRLASYKNGTSRGMTFAEVESGIAHLLN